MFIITGRIVKKYATKEVSATSHYRTCWIRTEEQNPQFIRMQLSGLKCVELDNFEMEDMVTIKFSISGQPKMKGSVQELYNNINILSMEKTA